MTGSPSKTRYRDGARRIAPIAVAAAAFGASFGVLSGTAGFDAIAAIVMSATTFAGSAQFAAASVLGAGGGVAAAATSASMLNARYGPIGVSVAPVIHGGLLRRLVESQLVVDESWASSRRPDGSYDRHLLIGSGLTLYVVWVGGTAAGAFAGDALGDPERFGLDAASPRSSWPSSCRRSEAGGRLQPRSPAGRSLSPSSPPRPLGYLSSLPRRRACSASEAK